MLNDGTKIYKKGDIDTGKSFDSFKKNDTERYINDDMRIYSRLAASTTYRANLRKAYDYCEQLQINDRITYVKYQIVITGLVNCNCKYEEVEAYRRIKDSEYRSLIIGIFTKENASKQIVNLVPEEYFDDAIVKKQR